MRMIDWSSDVCSSELTFLSFTQLYNSTDVRCPADVIMFDSAYDVDSTQEEIFDREVLPALGSVFAGLNTTMFVYGMTGAGTIPHRRTHARRSYQPGA